MNTATPFDTKDRVTARSLIPLVAMGSGLAAGQAAALELGDATVHSNLGQPLRASIAYALAPNEMLSDTCVSINAGRSTGGLPGIGPSAVSITEGAIVISGNAAIREPMLGTRITVNCPYTPNLSREYMLFVDPAPVAEARAVGATVEPVARRAAEPESRPATPAVSLAAVDDAPIGQSTRYQVQPGQSLGEIVSRIENRSMSLWPAVNLVFAANPDAFIDNDPNKLKAGSWLTIPSLDGSAPVVSAAATLPADVVSAAPAEEASSAPGPVASEPPASGASAAIAAYDPQATGGVVDSPVTESRAGDSTADLQPGDVVLGNDSVVESSATISIPDTRLEGPQTTSTSPNVPTAIVSTGSRGESTSLLAWLIGGGLAIITALILFGRRARGRFGSAPLGAAGTSRTPVGETPLGSAIAADQYDIEDDSPTEENLALDADLVTGDGLNAGAGTDVTRNFDFAPATDVDIELPFEPEETAPDGETDIIPTMRAGVDSILESEVLPEDDDYDMSVIIDATQMPQPEDVTERDLKAIEVGADDITLSTDNYTISREVDYDILEQDYEDELTATQALNQEIERAAAELAGDLGEDVEDTAEMTVEEATAERPSDEEKTSEMPLATVTELDVTAQLPAREESAPTSDKEPPRDPNDTAAVTVNMSSDDKTARMSVANDDETAEMEIEGGRVDTNNG